MAFAAAYALTRHPRWVLVVALSVGFGAELQSAAPVPIFGGSSDSWTPGVILVVAAALTVAAEWKLPSAADRRNLLVAAAIMLAAAAETKGFQGTADAGRDLFLVGTLAAQLVIAWRRTTLGIAAAIIVTGGILTESLSNRTGYIGMAILIAGVALAGAATLWNRLPSGGAPADEPPAAAA